MKESPAQARLDTLESADIMRLLPHRYPFLLVDRVVDMDGDRSATGIKNVTANEPYFQGHIPGNPIMPGVLLIEGMAQTAAALSIRFCESISLDYVSCSPYRVPIARLAAAQAVLEVPENRDA